MNDKHTPPAFDEEAIIEATRRWVDKAVIGLNLCPFAKAAQAKDRIRYAVTDAQTEDALLQALVQELERLAEASPERLETTLLIHPGVLGDFMDYNEFLDAADATVQELDLEGEIQIASFHPDYQFEGTAPDDIENFSNRSPYPMLHLLRESSVERAVQEYPDVDDIPERNVETLRRLGREGWEALMRKP